MLAGGLLLAFAVAASPQARDPAPSSPPFVDVAAAANLTWRVGYTRPYLTRERRAITEATFGGAAGGDCDGDGDIDLFVTYGNTGGPTAAAGPTVYI